MDEGNCTRLYCRIVALGGRESRSHLPYPLRVFFERKLKLLENLIQLR
jgi:hypothetical protein